MTMISSSWEGRTCCDWKGGGVVWHVWVVHDWPNTEHSPAAIPSHEPRCIGARLHHEKHHPPFAVLAALSANSSSYCPAVADADTRGTLFLGHDPSVNRVCVYSYVRACVRARAHVLCVAAKLPRGLGLGRARRRYVLRVHGYTVLDQPSPIVGDRPFSVLRPWPGQFDNLGIPR